MGRNIPKIIHQTYFTKNLPKEIYQVVEKLKRLNKNYEYRFYDDTDIIEYIKLHFNKRYLEAFLSINPLHGAAKADFFRYLVLYNEGGIYLDIKSSCSVPFDQLISDDDRYFISQWQNLHGQPHEGFGLNYKELKFIQGGEYQQWYLIAEPKSPFLKKVIDNVLNNIENYAPWKYGLSGYGKMGVLNVTGPIAYTLAIHPLLNQYQYRFSRFDKDFYLVYNALDNSQCHTKILNHYSKIKEIVIFPKNKIKFFLFNFYIKLAILLNYFFAFLKQLMPIYFKKKIKCFLK